jgi:hypothetical protein
MIEAFAACAPLAMPTATSTALKNNLRECARLFGSIQTVLLPEQKSL